MNRNEKKPGVMPVVLMIACVAGAVLMYARAGRPAAAPVRNLEITSAGCCLVDRVCLSSSEAVAFLAAETRKNPNLVVRIRVEKGSRYSLLAGLFDACQRNGITIAMATDPRPDAQ